MTRAEAFDKLRAAPMFKTRWDYELQDLITAMVALGVLNLRKPRRRTAK